MQGLQTGCLVGKRFDKLSMRRSGIHEFVKKGEQMIKRSDAGLLAALTVLIAIATPKLASAQNLTLEGQTGGFITPTAYVVESAKGSVLSRPSLGYHFVNAGDVIGDVQTASITEGFANWVEVGYARSAHTNGSNPYFSSLWEFSAMNVWHWGEL